MDVNTMDFMQAYKIANKEGWIVYFDLRLKHWGIGRSIVGDDRICFYPGKSIAELRDLFIVLCKMKGIKNPQMYM